MAETTAPHDRPEGTQSGKLVPFRGGPPPRRERDPRIDLFRGIALVMILIDHMPGNPYEFLTIRNFGFSDAAEAFFVMSGVAAGIAYSGAVARRMRGEGTLWSAISPMWSRAWTLYLTQILLTVVAMALFAWAADTFLRGEFRVWHNLGLMYARTSEALLGLALLTYQIGYVNILPTYTVLLIVAPLVIALGLRAPRLTLALSLAVWMAGGLWDWNIPNHPGGGGWFFAPTSWQAVFVLGLMIGIRHRDGARLVPVSRPLFALAAGFLALVLAWRFVPGLGPALNHKMAQAGALGVPDVFVSHNKTYLGLPRLLHVMALAYVISCIPAIRSWSAHPGLRVLRLLGQQGLLVFALGTVLALCGQILMEVEPDVTWLPWAVPPVAVALSVAAAWARDRAGRPATPRPPRVPVSKTSPMAMSVER